MLRVTMQSPGNTWNAAALQGLEEQLLAHVDRQWQERFKQTHRAFCSLAGRPKGLLVLSEKCRFHLA
eukprot:1267919-Amphidinium_carterae.1